MFITREPTQGDKESFKTPHLKYLSNKVNFSLSLLALSTGLLLALHERDDMDV